MYYHSPLDIVFFIICCGGVISGCGHRYIVNELLFTIFYIYGCGCMLLPVLGGNWRPTHVRNIVHACKVLYYSYSC